MALLALAALAGTNLLCDIHGQTARCYRGPAGRVDYWIYAYAETDHVALGLPAVLRRQERVYDRDAEFTEMEAELCGKWDEKTGPFARKYRWDCDLVYGHFQSWGIGFPRRSPRDGVLTLDTLKAPLRLAAYDLLEHWERFWTDCTREAKGRAYSGCDRGFESYVLEPALPQASAKQYPSRRLKTRALSIAAALDSGRAYHDVYLRAESKMKSPTEPWHFKPTDLPKSMTAELLAAERDLVRSLSDVRLLAGITP